MGIRQKLNDNPALSTAVAVFIFVVATTYVVRLVWTDADGGGAFSDKAFFTVDDGDNWFIGNADQIPPFEVSGRSAVRAKVFECADGKTFVGYLERYDAADKKKIEHALKTGDSELRADQLYLSTMEVKKPGDTVWVKNTPQNSKRCQEIMSPVCPGNPAGEPPRLVLPQ